MDGLLIENSYRRFVVFVRIAAGLSIGLCLKVPKSKVERTYDKLINAHIDQ